jgi:hypothetical protein
VRKEPCPVCGDMMLTFEEWTDGQYILEESQSRCQNGCYNYVFEHGNYWCRVGDQEWEWSCTFPYNQVQEIKQQIKAAIEQQKGQTK